MRDETTTPEAMDWGAPPPAPPATATFDTPIPSRLIGWLVVIAALLLAVAWLSTLPATIDWLSAPKTLLINAMLVMAAFAFVYLPCEPLGAWLGAWIGELRVREAVVGPVTVTRRAGRWRATRSRGFAPWKVQVEPAESDLSVLRDGMPWLVGGHLAGAVVRWGGMLAGIVSVVVVVVGWPGLIVATPVLGLVLLMGVGLSLPSVRLLRVLRRGGPAAERLLAVKAVDAAEAAGTRPRDWEPWMPALTGVVDRSPNDVEPWIAASFHALDRGDLAAAGDALAIVRWGLAGQPGKHPRPLPEVGYLAARVHGDPAALRQLLAQLKPGVLKPATQRRLAAAMLLADGRPAEALAAARAGLAALDGAEPTGMAAFDRDQLIEIAALAERALA